MRFGRLFRKILRLRDIRYLVLSYSQTGEDLIIQKILKNVTKGFYVDVGAFHPTLYSNTKILYDRGWNGLNIEPSVQGYKALKRKRKRDINIRYAVGPYADVTLRERTSMQAEIK